MGLTLKHTRNFIVSQGRILPVQSLGIVNLCPHQQFIILHTVCHHTVDGFQCLSAVHHLIQERIIKSSAFTCGHLADGFHQGVFVSRDELTHTGTRSRSVVIKQVGILIRRKTHEAVCKRHIGICFEAG